MSIDFESTSTTRSGEKPYATFNCWMGTPGGQWLARVDAENEQIVGWEISLCSEDCIWNEFLGLYYKWMASLPKVASYCVEPRRRIGRPAKRWDDQMQSFPQENFHSSWFQAAKCETWSSHEKSFCTVVLGTLMFGCSCFPCPSRTVALTRTGIVCLCVCVCGPRFNRHRFGGIPLYPQSNCVASMPTLASLKHLKIHHNPHVGS